MIDVYKWDNITEKGKLEFVKGVMNVTNTNCVSNEDWEIMCRFLLDEVMSCHNVIYEYRMKLDEQNH